MRGRCPAHRLHPADTFGSSRPGAGEGLVHYSTWEPRPDNYKRNYAVSDAAAVHRALEARPRAVRGAYDARWDSWLVPRIDGQFAGTTDEVFQCGPQMGASGRPVAGDRRARVHLVSVRDLSCRPLRGPLRLRGRLHDGLADIQGLLPRARPLRLALVGIVTAAG